MSQGFLIWTDFHPILVGAGCLALGYVYGRHCRTASEFQADVASASDDVCCAQSHSNTYFEDLERPCKCCVSAPAELDAVALGNGKASKFTRSPYLVSPYHPHVVQLCFLQDEYIIYYFTCQGEMCFLGHGL